MYKREKTEIIYWAKKIYDKEFALGTSGNISLRLGKNKILITAANSYLGHLKLSDLSVLDLKGNIIEGKQKPTSEKKLHLDIHNNFKQKVVLHAHPLYTTLYFSRFSKLKPISFEIDLYLKDFKVIPQKAYNVINTKPVLEALGASNIVVLKNHGVVAAGEDFKQAFSLIEILEKEAKANAILKLIHG